ncbi:MAG: hypothetical protein ABR956_04180 [Terracidiphilus sp.]|jgi:hypothetical protein
MIAFLMVFGCASCLRAIRAVSGLPTIILDEKIWRFCIDNRASQNVAGRESERTMVLLLIRGQRGIEGDWKTSFERLPFVQRGDGRDGM